MATFERDATQNEIPTACSLPNVAQGHDQTLNMGSFWTYEAHHWVAVDFDADEGWTFSKDRSRVMLAPGLCNELHKPAPRIARIITYSGSSGCPPKLPTQPECADTGSGAAGSGGGGGGGGGGSGGGGSGGMQTGTKGGPSPAGGAAADGSPDAGPPK